MRYERNSTTRKTVSAQSTPEENMGKITISLSNQGEKILRNRAKRNMRSISKEIEYLVIDAENKDKVK